jgi:hypothetical protein
LQSAHFTVVSCASSGVCRVCVAGALRGVECVSLESAHLARAFLTVSRGISPGALRRRERPPAKHGLDPTLKSLR